MNNYYTKCKYKKLCKSYGIRCTACARNLLDDEGDYFIPRKMNNEIFFHNPMKDFRAMGFGRMKNEKR